MPRAVDIIEPQDATSPVVFASPHSGRVYPQAFLSAVEVDPLVLRSSEDAYVDLLLAAAPEFGAPLITSQVPRAYVDFNRAADELDPALVFGAPRAGLNPRIASGLGVLARVVANGRTIYRGKIPMDEAKARIAQYWHPYHETLSATLTRQHKRFGHVLLCDVHSMPHEALTGHVSRGAARPDQRPHGVAGGGIGRAPLGRRRGRPPRRGRLRRPRSLRHGRGRGRGKPELRRHGLHRPTAV
jgi:N-formylglutamate amidohydrolase